MQNKYPKPIRPANMRPPGQPVELLSNLFEIKIKDKTLAIYRYAVEIHFLSSKERESGDDPPIPAKLSADLRKQVLKAALEKWLKQMNPPTVRGKKYSYVFSHKVSTMFALFNMFDKNVKNNILEISVDVEMDKIINSKLERVVTAFKVRLSSGKRIDISNSVETIKKSGETASATSNEVNEAINTIQRSQIVMLPNFQTTMTSVFPFSGKRGEEFKLGDKGITMNKGTYMSTKITECGLTVNIANTVGVFQREFSLLRLIELKLGKLNQNSSLKPHELEYFNNEIAKKQVEARHKNYGKPNGDPHYRRYRVDCLGANSEETFMMKDNNGQERRVSVLRYFELEYKYKVMYPKLPCVKSKNRLIPIEVCHFVDKQRVLRKMTPMETSEIIKQTAVPADQHFKNIEENVKDLSRLWKQPMLDFGLDPELNQIRVMGRELQVIPLIGAGRDMKPNDGQYDARSARFILPTAVKKWGITFIRDFEMNRDSQKEAFLWARTFAPKYTQGGIEKGVQIQMCEKPVFIDIDSDKRSFQMKFKEHFGTINNNNYDHNIFILPKNDMDYLYRFIQYLEATTKPAIPGRKVTRATCIKYENYKNKVVFSRDDGKMFISNLWLKYNTKLGGRNYTLKPNPKARYLNDGYLFISVDICHPSPNDKLIQSVAAVVGMWDLTSQKLSFTTRLRVQKKMDNKNKSTIEKVVEIGLLVSDIVNRYKKSKGKLPTHIVILRDGVSEGQLDMVQDEELRQIDGKLIQIYGNQKTPLVTCIVVQKRHKTRFMRIQGKEDRRGNKDHNIQPGTVVDNKVVHPVHHTFYLAAHKAIKGTSRPAYNFLTRNDIKLDQYELEEMLLALSYLSPRCTKGTSIPTPIDLADLAAERGKNLVICWVDDHNSRMSEEERIKNLNNFLSQIGDPDYLNTLFYV